jgi:hypothetical protein
MTPPHLHSSLAKNDNIRMMVSVFIVEAPSAHGGEIGTAPPSMVS